MVWSYSCTTFFFLLRIIMFLALNRARLNGLTRWCTRRMVCEVCYDPTVGIVVQGQQNSINSYRSDCIALRACCRLRCRDRPASWRRRRSLRVLRSSCLPTWSSPTPSPLTPTRRWGTVPQNARWVSFDETWNPLPADEFPRQSEPSDVEVFNTSLTSSTEASGVMTLILLVSIEGLGRKPQAVSLAFLVSLTCRYHY